MKNHLQKILLAFCLVLITCLFQVNSAQAQQILKDEKHSYVLDSEKIHISTRVQAGHLSGTANEIVYAGSFSNDLLSKLIWEIDNLNMAGIGVTIQKE